MSQSKKSRTPSHNLVTHHTAKPQPVSGMKKNFGPRLAPVTLPQIDMGKTPIDCVDHYYARFVMAGRRALGLALMAVGMGLGMGLVLSSQQAEATPLQAARIAPPMKPLAGAWSANGPLQAADRN